MKRVGLFEAKTKLSEICGQVSASGQGILITRRGKPFVRIDPIVEKPQGIRERRAEYLARYKEDEDAEDFEPPARSTEKRDFEFGD